MSKCEQYLLALTLIMTVAACAKSLPDAIDYELAHQRQIASHQGLNEYRQFIAANQFSDQ